MNRNKNIKTPVGLEPVVAAVETICRNSAAYRRCGMKPNHFLINLDKGNGQSTLTAYITDVFQAYGIRHFGGLDAFLEYTLDGSMTQLENIFRNIRTCAVYTNDYEGIVSMDISALAAPNHAAQLSLFLKGISSVGEHATVILFVPSGISQSIAALIRRVHEALPDTEVIRVAAYTEQNLADIVKELIAEAGISGAENADDRLRDLIHSAGAATVKDARHLAQELIKNADFESFTPKLTMSALMQTPACSPLNGR